MTIQKVRIIDFPVMLSVFTLRYCRNISDGPELISLNSRTIFP